MVRYVGISSTHVIECSSGLREGRRRERHHVKCTAIIHRILWHILPLH